MCYTLQYTDIYWLVSKCAQRYASVLPVQLAVMVWAHYVCLVMGDRQFATKEEPTPVPPPAEKGADVFLCQL